MVFEPSRYPLPSRPDMLLSLGVRCFRSLWMLTIRCSCGRERETPLPALAKTGLGEREVRTLGDLVRRLRCEDCGKPPGSVIASYEPSHQLSCDIQGAGR